MKNFYSRIFPAILLIILCNISDAQNTGGEQSRTIDSVKKIVATTNIDTIKIKALNFLTENASETEWPAYNDQMLAFAKEKLKTETKGKPLYIFYRRFLADGINNLGILLQDAGDIEKCIAHYKEALKIKEEINDNEGVATVNNNIGLVYVHTGDGLKGLDYFKRALIYFEKLGDKQAMAMVLINIGSVYERQGYVPLALEYFHKALKIQEETGDKNGIANSLTNIAGIYDAQKNRKTALEYYEKALAIKKEANNKRGISILLNNIAVIFKEDGEFQKAIDVSLQSLKIKEELGDKKGIGIVCNNLGSIYFSMKDMSKALAYFDKALNVNEEINYKEGLCLAYKNLGSYYMTAGNSEKATAYGLKSLALSKELGAPHLIKLSSGLMVAIYKIANKPAKALEMFELHMQMKDSVSNIENRKASLKQQFQYEYDKKVAADSVRSLEEKKLTSLKIAAQETQIKQEKTQRIALYGGLILVIVFAGFMFNRFKITQKQKNIIALQKTEVEGQKHLIEEKQKEIVDSITYAKRLQEAILPADIFWKENLKESFILYKPKDIVAGDFYWMETISQQSAVGLEQLVLFAAADCTGHGVPGALVSVVCSNALNRTVLEFGIKDPGKILDKTRELVIATFEKSDKDVKDGMDISLCCLNKTTNELHWAGANNGLWIVHSPLEKGGGQRPGDLVLTELKPDKQPIGKYAEAKPFTTHTIKLNKNDCIYLFTDGMADQFGGEKGKKFKYKQLKAILLQQVNEDMSKQKEKLNTAFENWKGDLEQVDDVCVIGMKI